MSKLLLAIQYWSGDRAQAMRLARLVADLEPRHNSEVDVLFVSRFDCEHDMKTVEYVSTKFKVHHYINRHRRGTGWPAGCNDLWFGTMDHIYSFTEAKRLPQYEAILCMEADSSPLVPDWHRRLIAAWRKANDNPNKPVKVFGALVPYPKPHINGNGMFSGDLGFLHLVSRKIGGCPPMYGWDFHLTKDFSRAGWANCPLINSFWQEKTISDERLNALIDAEVCFLHGIKDDSVLDYVRNRFVR